MVARDQSAIARRGERQQQLDPDVTSAGEPVADPMGELRDAIEGSRSKIADSLETLHDEVERRTDWRGWVREHPLESVGVAFFVGLVVGARPYL